MTSYRRGVIMLRELRDIIGLRDPRTLSPQCIGFWYTWARVAIRMYGWCGRAGR